MTTENNNAANQGNKGPAINLTKPASDINVRVEIAEPTHITVNVGFPGKMARVTVPANCTIADVLNTAGINANGYDLRMKGEPARLNSIVSGSGINILLIKPVRGNHSEEHGCKSAVNLSKPTTGEQQATQNINVHVEVAEPATVTVNVGFPGKMSRVTVPANSCIEDVLHAAGINPTGYDLRMKGEPARLNSVVNGAGINILLIKPVRGNNSEEQGSKPAVNLSKPATNAQPTPEVNVRVEIAEPPMVTVNVGFPGKMSRVTVPANSSIADVLHAAGICAHGYDLRMKGEPARLDSVVNGGGINILLIKPVRGNHKETV
jgi:sulfur carrier protein ThiS